MIRYIYADLLFIINFLADFLILFLTMRFSGASSKPIKLLFSSLLGAAFGVLLLLFFYNNPFSAIFALLFPCILCIVAFGKKRVSAFMIIIFYFYFSSILLFGGMYAMMSFLSMLFSSNFFKDNFILTVILCAAVTTVFFVFSSFCSRAAKHSENLVKAEIFDGNVVYNMNLLVDSGNLAKDPFSGKPVTVVSGNAVNSELIQALSCAFDQKNCSEKYSHIKLRVIPVKTVSGTALLYAFVPESMYVYIDNQKCKADSIIAIDTHKNAFFGKDGIIPQTLLEII